MLARQRRPGRFAPGFFFSGLPCGLRGSFFLALALLDALAAGADFPVPDCLLEAEFEQVWQRRQAERRAGRSDAAGLCKRFRATADLAVRA